MSLRMLSLLLVAACLVGCEKPSGQIDGALGLVTIKPGTPPIDLRADVNRNGTLELEAAGEDENEDTWDQTHGAIFLPNVDDDASRCKTTDAAGRQLDDATVPLCNDGFDTEINGADDLADLAPLALKAWPEVPAGSTVRLTIEPATANVRLFKRVGDSWRALELPETFSTGELAAGVSLLLEGRDVLRNSQWDGFVDVTVEVTVPEQKYWVPGTYRDTVKLRMAPVLTFHHLQPVETAYVTAVPRDPDSTQFVSDIRAAVAFASPSMQLLAPSLEDQWTQDFFETGYASMPGLDGAQRVMRVFFRSANIENPFERAYPLRQAGRVVFSRFRGKDVAAIQQVDMNSPYEIQTLNSFGNFETIPPYENGTERWPLGRVIRGSVPGYAPDVSFVAMTEAQRYQEPSINVDTSWLLVGHIDESVSFLKASTPRGWVLLANDARLARQMLEDAAAQGKGSTQMFIGKQWIDERGDETPAVTTIQRVLQNTEVMEASAEAATKVDAQLAIIKRATGLTDAEIIKVPFLHEPVQGSSLAYQPGTVNLFVIDDKTLAVPSPHGPVIDGVDIFKKQLEDALAPYQYRIRWVDDWNLYHRAAGEVHCGTNAMRAIPSTKWWEVAR